MTAFAATTEPDMWSISKLFITETRTVLVLCSEYMVVYSVELSFQIQVAMSLCCPYISAIGKVSLYRPIFHKKLEETGKRKKGKREIRIVNIQLL